MPTPEEVTIIQGLRAGGTERRRFENSLWKKFYGFIYWGISKYNLPVDEVRHAYDDTICSVIINIVTGRYVEDANALLKTYAVTIFHNKCVDRIHQTSKDPALRKAVLSDRGTHQPTMESLSERLPDHVKNVIEAIIEKEDHAKMRKCLEKTGEACKEILRLYASGYKDREIAGMMHYNTADVVKQTRYRCMEKLSNVYLNMYQYE